MRAIEKNNIKFNYLSYGGNQAKRSLFVFRLMPHLVVFLLNGKLLDFDKLYRRQNLLFIP
jgi:hypothetical protein